MSKPSYSASFDVYVDKSSVEWGDYANFDVELTVRGSGRHDVGISVFSRLEIASSTVDENDFEIIKLSNATEETDYSIIERTTFWIRNRNQRNRDALARLRFFGEISWTEWHGNTGVTHTEDFSRAASTYLQTWRPTQSMLRIAKSEILSTETTTAEVDFVSQPPGFPAPTITIRSSAPSKTVITRTGEKTFTIGWSDYSLGENTKITLTSRVSATIEGTTYFDEDESTLTIKPSLTGVEISTNNLTLNYTNSFSGNCTATPLPKGTGAPIDYYFTPLGNDAGKLAVSQSGRVGTIKGRYSNYSIIPVRVRAQLRNSNIYFDKTLNVQVRPNIRLQENGFKNGQPYIYDNGWKEAKEVYIYENGWRINRVE